MESASGAKWLQMSKDPFKFGRDFEVYASCHRTFSNFIRKKAEFQGKRAAKKLFALHVKQKSYFHSFCPQVNANRL
jgi:hypothetical protein